MAALAQDCVLSDVHVSESHARDINNDNHSLQTYVSRYYFHVQTDLHLSKSEATLDLEGTISCLPCHRLNYSPAQIIFLEKKRKFTKETLLLDEDGDHILPRRNKKNKTLHPDLKKTSFTKEPCDPILSQKEVTSHSSQLQAAYDVSDVSQIEDELFTVKQCHSIEPTEPFRIQTEYKDFVADSNVYFTRDVTCANSIEKTERDMHTIDKFQISIEHKMGTMLPEVGFQVWSGALLLCDYLIHNCTELEDKHVLDLGSGTGITSIVAAMFARCVVCSDYSFNLMELAERNWLRNKDYLPHRHCCKIYFKVLDWTCDYPPVKENSSGSKYQITKKDLNLIEEATIIIAAEVVYDEDLTRAFFKTIYHLLSNSPPKSIVMALEKRPRSPFTGFAPRSALASSQGHGIVFSSESHQICSPAYEDFCENLADLTSIDEGPLHFSAVKISTEFPEYFHYKRHKNLELWKISSISMM
ncbi:unnamed protein product [Lymnaea stagnalis]|uniref:Methyltransferase-like protein 22 n=1 Tax=Lymnaea stagnalis TaxID=6523 RepID=A0AAV2H5L4_LYMST